MIKPQKLSDRFAISAVKAIFSFSILLWASVALGFGVKAPPIQVTNSSTDRDQNYDALLHDAAFLPGSDPVYPSEDNFIADVRSANVNGGHPGIGSGTVVGDRLIVSAAHIFCNLKTGQWKGAKGRGKPSSSEIRRNTRITVNGCGDQRFPVEDIIIRGNCDPNERADGESTITREPTLIVLKEPVCSEVQRQSVYALDDRLVNNFLVDEDNRPVNQIRVVGNYKIEEEDLDQIASSANESQPMVVDPEKSRQYSSEGRVVRISGFDLKTRSWFRGDVSPGVLGHMSNTNKGASGGGVFLAPGNDGVEYLVGVHVGTGSAHLTGGEARGFQDMNLMILIDNEFRELIRNHPAR